MKAKLSRVIVYLGALLLSTVALPDVRAEDCATPYCAISVPPVRQCDESTIPSSAFEDGGSVLIQLNNVSAGVLSVGVCDGGDNAVICSLEKVSDSESEGAKPLNAQMHSCFSGDLRFYELRYTVDTPGSYLVRISGDGDSPVSQDVELRVGMLSTSVSGPVQPGEFTIVGPVEHPVSHPVGIWIGGGVVLFVTLSLFVFLLVRAIRHRRQRKDEYTLLTPHGPMLIQLSKLRPGTAITVGRSSSCNLRLNDAQVSARHGMLLQVSGQLVYTDIGSSNGSYINGQRIPSNQTVVLHRGSVLQLGTRVSIHIR